MSTLTQQEVTSKILFELERSEELNISPFLLSYLQTHQYPWAALGTSMLKFVESCIAQTPESERIKGTIHKTAYIEHSDKLVIGEGAIIEPYAYITGPAFIEPHAVVRHGAYVRGPMYISAYAIIGHTTECKGSILLPHAKAAHFNYVGDSILGYNCNLGAGTKLANLKHSHDNIILRFNEERINSNLRKFGAIIGNRASLGCNSVANPGSIFLPDSILNPNETALGIIQRRAKNPS